MHSDVLSYLDYHDYTVITVTADHECVGTNCSDAYSYPIIHFKAPDPNHLDKYDQYEVNHITVYFDKVLETAPEVTFIRIHHLIHDKIEIEGLHLPPRVTHNKL